MCPPRPGRARDHPRYPDQRSEDRRRRVLTEQRGAPVRHEARRTHTACPNSRKERPAWRRDPRAGGGLWASPCCCTDGVASQVLGGGPARGLSSRPTPRAWAAPVQGRRGKALCAQRAIAVGGAVMDPARAARACVFGGSSSDGGWCGLHTPGPPCEYLKRCR